MDNFRGQETGAGERRSLCYFVSQENLTATLARQVGVSGVAELLTLSIETVIPIQDIFLKSYWQKPKHLAAFKSVSCASYMFLIAS